jgi:hypothetical protein
VIKRGAIIIIGTVILVAGLTGLALLQTGVICPPASIGPVNTPEVQSSVPAPESGKQVPGPAGGPERQPSPSLEQGQGPSAQGGQQPPSANLGTQKPIAVPQVGNGERRYPRQNRVEQPRAVARSAQLDRKRRQAAAKSERERFARKSESKRNARKAASAHTAKPVVIRFNFDPALNRRLDLAQVHLGDKIRVKVRQVGWVDRRVYLAYSNSPDSPQGAVLMLETMVSFERRGAYRHNRGYYVIEVKIYPGNRWNIHPRSFV